MCERRRHLEHHVRRSPHAIADDRLAAIDDECDIGTQDEPLAAIEYDLQTDPEPAEGPGRDVRIERRMHAIDEFVVADRRRRFGASYISVNSVMGTDSVGHICLTTTMTPPNRKNNRLLDYCATDRADFFLRRGFDRILRFSSFSFPSFPMTSNGWLGARNRLKN